MYNIFLSKQAKKDLEEHRINEREVTIKVLEKLSYQKLSSKQDILALITIEGTKYGAVGRKHGNTVTITDVISNILIADK